MSEVNDLGPQNDGEPVAVEVPAETPEVEPNEGEPAPEQEPEKPHRLPGSARAKARAERLEAENEALRQMLVSQQAKPDAPKPPPQGEPKLDDYAEYSDYMRALVQFEAKKLRDEEKAQESIAKRQESLNQTLAKGRAKYEDFDADFAEIRRAPLVSQAVAEALTDSEVAPDLVHYFADNPQELQRISLLPAYKAGKELAALEAKYTTPQKPARSTSAAPPPPVPVGGRGVPVVDESKLSDEEWAAQKRRERLR